MTMINQDELETYVVTLSALVGWARVFRVFGVSTPPLFEVERIAKHIENTGAVGEERQRLWARAFIHHCRTVGVDPVQRLNL